MILEGRKKSLFRLWQYLKRS